MFLFYFIGFRCEREKGRLWLFIEGLIVKNSGEVIRPSLLKAQG